MGVGFDPAGRVSRGAVDIAGTPYSLHYMSSRLPGGSDEASIQIPLVFGGFSDELKKIRVRVEVAGQITTREFQPRSPLKYTYEWDGEDGYGRFIGGSQPVDIDIEYVYQGYYKPQNSSGNGGQSFGQSSSGQGSSNRRKARRNAVIRQRIDGDEDGVYVWKPDARQRGLGGWSLSDRHELDRRSHVIEHGDGTRRKLPSTADNAFPIETVAGVDPDVYTVSPQGCDVGPDGSLYVADPADSCVTRLTPSGSAEVVAGNGLSGFSGNSASLGEDATAGSAFSPTDVAVDSKGTVYFATKDYGRVLSVDDAGDLRPIAGTRQQSTSGSGTTNEPTDLTFREATALEAGPDDKLYLATQDGRVVYRIDPETDSIARIAGTGEEAYNYNNAYEGDGTQATAATFGYVVDFGFDPQGRLHVADGQYGVVFRLEADGTLTTVAGDGDYADDTADGDGGPATQASFRGLLSFTFSDDEMLVSDSGTVRKIDSSGTISTVAGGNATDSSPIEGPAQNVRIERPLGIVGTDTGYYLTDVSLSLVRHVSGGTATRVLGATQTIVDDGNVLRDFHTGYGGPATDAAVGQPDDIAVADDGTVYFCDSLRAVVDAVDPDGTYRRVAGRGDEQGYTGDGGPATAAKLRQPTALALADDGTLYIAEEGNHVVRAVRPDGTITTVAGTGSFGSGGDGGPATQATMSQPTDVALDGDGNVYVAEGEHVRRITPSGTISTVVGGGTQSVQDGVAATDASFSPIDAIAARADGTLYVGEGLVWKVDTGGQLRRFAGSAEASQGDSGDGGPARKAHLIGVADIEVGPTGSVFVAESSGRRVRRISTDGTIFTAVGSARKPGHQKTIGEVAGIAVDSKGALYVGDKSHYAVRRIDLLSRSSPLRQIPSTDGRFLYEFLPDGRHNATIDALTGEAVRSFQYDKQGRLSGIGDADDNLTSVERDSNGTVTALVSPDGLKTSLTVDGDGLLTKVTDPAGRTQSFTYGNGGVLKKYTDRDGNTTTFGYDGSGALDTYTDAHGKRTTLSLNATLQRRDVTIETAAGRTETISITQDDPGLRFSTDTSGVEFTASQSGSTVEFPDGGDIETEVGPDPRFGARSPVPRKMTTTTPSGRTERRLTSRSATLANDDDPLSLQTLTTKQTVAGETTKTTYDASTRTVTTNLPSGETTTASLDAAGRVTEQTASSLATTRFDYDGRGRTTRVAVTDGRETRERTYAYGRSGYLASTTDPVGNTTTFTRDELGQLLAVEYPDGRTLRLTIDATGNVAGVVPPGRPRHGLQYDALGRLEAYDPPGNDGTYQYTYDADGYLETVTPPSGAKYAITRNDAGRPTTESLPRGSVNYTYANGSDNLEKVDGPDGSTLSWSYDGRLVTEETLSGPVSGTVSWGYDDRFRVTSQTIGGTTVSFDYDTNDQRVQAGDLTVTRDGDGLVTGTTLKSLSQTWRHDDFADLEHYHATVGGSKPLEIDYSTDARGRVTETTETTPTGTTSRRYEYDATGRLTTVREGGTVTERYEYDDNDNLARTVRHGTSKTASYDDRDRIESYGDIDFTFDADGRLTSETDTASGATTTYDYDVQGTLLGVTLGDGTAIDYEVDPAGRRVGKRVDGTLERGWLYDDGLSPAAELDANGNVTARFVYGTLRRTPDYMVKNGTTYAILSDHLGSVRFVVDAGTGSVAQRMEYDAFGRVVTDTNPGFQPFGFAGGLYDPDTGLVRFGLRDYDPRVGRWTAPDPLGFSAGRPNLYTYGGADPVNTVDPTGEFAISGTTVAVLLIGGALLGGGVEAGRQYAVHGEVKSWGKVGIWSGVGGVTVFAGGIIGEAGYGTYTTVALTTTVDMTGGAGGKLAENALARSQGQCIPLDQGVYSTAVASGTLSIVGSGVSAKFADVLHGRNVSRLKTFLQDARANNLAEAGDAAFSKSVPVTTAPTRNFTPLLKAGSSAITESVSTEIAGKFTPNAGYSAIGGQCRGSSQ